MGNGKAPAGIDLDTPGTDRRWDVGAHRIADAGPIGLDAKSGDAKQSGASIAEQIVSYARRRAARASATDSASRWSTARCVARTRKSAADYGTVTPNADYQWGSSVTLADLQPGDVIQFRDYTYERVVVTKDDTGTTTDEDAGDRPHHTAVVESVDGNGAVTVLEQNAPDGSAVRRSQLYFTGGTTTSGNRTTTITVRGTFWFYRPQAN